MLVGVVLSTVLLTACQTTGPERAAPVSADRRPASAPAPASSRTSGPAAVTKLLVVTLENHSLREMRSEMPATFAFARKYGFATSYRAITHPSLPNYLAIAGGSTFGVTDDDSPASHRLQGPSVFGQAIDAGKTAKVYAEGMPGACALEPGGRRYAVKHNPWAYFVDERPSCRRYDVPLDRLATDVAAGDLPNAGLVVPDLCHDAHDADCDLGDADDWLKDEMGAVLAGPDFASGHLAVVITADEDDRSQGNLVLTTVLHPSQQGHVVRTPLTHYSLTGLYDRVLGVRLLRRAARAPSMAKAFGLPLPQR
jgi:acid phosphatase